MHQSLGERQRMKSGIYCYGINSHYVMSFVIKNAMGERKRMKLGIYFCGINFNYVISFLIMLVEEPTRRQNLTEKCSDFGGPTLFSGIL